MGRALAADLEVLPLEDEPGRPGQPVVAAGSGPPRRRRRLVAASLSCAILLFALAGPIRSQLAARQAGHLWRDWLQAQSDGAARALPASQLYHLGYRSDPERVALGTAALDDEEAAMLGGLQARLGGRHVPDHGVARLRGLMTVALADQVADLRTDGERLRRTRSAPGGIMTASTVAAGAAVDAQLGVERDRFQLVPPRPPAPPVLHAADADLAALSRYLDQPARAWLAVTEQSGDLDIVDVDDSRQFSAWPLGSLLITRTVLRRGYLAYQLSDGTVYAGPLDLSGPAHVIVLTGNLVAAARPDAIWSQTPAGAVEVEGDGRRVAGPVALPADAALVGASSGSLFSQSGPSLLMTSLATHRTSVLAPVGVLMSAQDDAVAWVAANAGRQLMISTDGGATSRPVKSPPGYEPGSSGAFSSDDRRLAVVWQALGQDRDAVGLVPSTRSGALVTGPAQGEPAGSLAWSPGGDRLFFGRGRPILELWTWASGDPGPRQLRVRPARGGEGLVALPAPGA